MKTIFTIIIFACAFVALYEQSLPKPNLYIMLPAIAVFMIGLMWLMNRVPSKNNRKDNEDEV